MALEIQLVHPPMKSGQPHMGGTFLLGLLAWIWTSIETEYQDTLSFYGKKGNTTGWIHSLPVGDYTNVVPGPQALCRCMRVRKAGPHLVLSSLCAFMISGGKRVELLKVAKACGRVEVGRVTLFCLFLTFYILMPVHYRSPHETYTNKKQGDCLSSLSGEEVTNW